MARQRTCAVAVGAILGRIVILVVGVAAIAAAVHVLSRAGGRGVRDAELAEQSDAVRRPPRSHAADVGDGRCQPALPSRRVCSARSTPWMRSVLPCGRTAATITARPARTR